MSNKKCIEEHNAEDGHTAVLWRVSNSQTGITSGYRLETFAPSDNGNNGICTDHYDTDSAFNALERWEKRHNHDSSKCTCLDKVKL